MFDHARVPTRGVTLRRPASPLALGRVFGAVLLVLPAGLTAVEVPFPTERPVDAGFNGAISVHAGDIDGDGDLDVVGASNFTDDVVWWENTAGDGTSWTEHPIDLDFGQARSVLAADVDGDGDLDVFGAAHDADDIAWWENTAGDGSAWTEHLVDASFNGPLSIEVADMDGDGDLDALAAGWYSSEVAWWENTNGVGTTWSKHSVDSAFLQASSATAVDLDGDGDLDVIATAFNADDVAWWENTAGDGSAWTERTIDSSFDGAISVLGADLDGDGDLDVLGAANIADDVTWWENTAGNGTTWTERAVDADFDGASSVTAADLDGDGDLDLLGAASAGGDVTWWENTAGNASAWTERVIEDFFSQAYSVRSADVDGDGDLDVLGAGQGDGVAWWENTTLHRSAHYLFERTIESELDQASSVWAADMDGDGDVDVLGGSSVDGAILWKNDNGVGTAWTAQSVVLLGVARAMRAADIDGDGDRDIVGVRQGPHWWENTSGDGTAWTEREISSARSFAVDAADIDGDGDVDIVATHWEDDNVIFWENAFGDGTGWIGHLIVDSFDLAEPVHAADIDGDGDMDVVAGARQGNELSWFENDAAGDGSVWTEHVVHPAIPSPGSVRAADLDGDGDLDILCGRVTIPGHIEWWDNTAGDGSAWTSHTIDNRFNYARWARSLFAADLDDDGDLDVLGAAAISDDVTWWENAAGDGTAWSKHTIDDDFITPRAVHAADVDRDGDLDVLAAANSGDDVAWWPNFGGQFALPTVDIASAVLQVGGLGELLAIEAIHRGRDGDTDLELTSFELLFRESAGDPLTTGEANALIESLRIYRDADDSGTLDATDPMVASVDTLALNTAGIQTVSFADGSAEVRVAHASPRRYFVAVELTASAPAQSPNRFQVLHLTGDSSTAEDADHDIPLSLEYLDSVASGTVVAAESCPDQLVLSQGALNGGDYRAAIGITVGVDLAVDGDPQAVGLIAGESVTFADNVEITGSFSVEISATPCP